jgi:hypothetical protein
MAERRITLGARDLRTWLTKQKKSIPTFCEEHHLDRIRVQRVINGEQWQRISVDFARAIETATGGAVRWSRWLSMTAIIVDAVPTKRSA